MQTPTCWVAISKPTKRLQPRDHVLVQSFNHPKNIARLNLNMKMRLLPALILFYQMSCTAENIFEKMEPLLKRLSDGETLYGAEDRTLRSLLNEYWDVVCPSDQSCNRNTCNLARTNDWIAYQGYSCAWELLEYFQYEGVEHLGLKSFRTPEMPWIRRRQGHYNP